MGDWNWDNGLRGVEGDEREFSSDYSGGGAESELRLEEGVCMHVNEDESGSAVEASMEHDYALEKERQVAEQKRKEIARRQQTALRKGLFSISELEDYMGDEYPMLDKQTVIRFPLDVAKMLKERLLQAQENGVGGDELGLTIAPTEELNYRLFDVKVTGYNSKLCGVLLELPALVETYKCLDGDMLFKSGDIGQMLFVYDPSIQELDLKSVCDRQHWEWKSGLTPPTHRIRTRKFKNFDLFDRQEIRDAEVEILNAHTEYEMAENKNKVQWRQQTEMKGSNPPVRYVVTASEDVLDILMQIPDDEDNSDASEILFAVDGNSEFTSGNKKAVSRVAGWSAKAEACGDNHSAVSLQRGIAQVPTDFVDGGGSKGHVTYRPMGAAVNSKSSQQAVGSGFIPDDRHINVHDSIYQQAEDTNENQITRDDSRERRRQKKERRKQKRDKKKALLQLKQQMCGAPVVPGGSQVHQGRDEGPLDQGSLDTCPPQEVMAPMFQQIISGVMDVVEVAPAEQTRVGLLGVQPDAGSATDENDRSSVDSTEYLD